MNEEKLKIPYPIIVEGKYDRLRLISVADARIYTTEGFGIFSRSEKLSLFKALANKTPIILLTDSDGAGKLIRSHITGAIPKEKLIQLYIPSVEGKEKRKKEPSKEGTLGVEGMERELLRSILAPYAVNNGSEKDAYSLSLENPLSKSDFYMDGLSGRDDSAAARDALAKKLGLPPKMTANALLSAIKLLLTYDEYLSAVGRDEKNSQK